MRGAPVSFKHQGLLRGSVLSLLANVVADSRAPWPCSEPGHQRHALSCGLRSGAGLIHVITSRALITSSRRVKTLRAACADHFFDV